ncbi:MAG TPA: hypothetical protein VGJ00_05440 [Rhabdochlamydiaceae bacterium]|jgi:hypothetical protein
MNENFPDELRDALMSAIDGHRLRMSFIDPGERPMHKAYTDVKYLAKFLCYWQKQKKKIKLRNRGGEESEFWKLILEGNIPLGYQEEKIFGRLGIQRELAALTAAEKKRIKVQVVAQILWRLHSDQYLTITALVEDLQNKQFSLYALLDLQRFQSARDLANKISPIFPVSKEDRPYWAREGIATEELRPIPRIYSKKGVNLAKLRFAVQQIGKILKHFGWRPSQILHSEFIQKLEGPLPEQIRIFLREWALEAFEE